MRICAAQLQPTAGDIHKNTVKHIALVDMAASQNTDVLVFPELSLTGYEPNLASSLAIKASDARLNVFQKLSEQYAMVIGVGIPLKTATGVHIALAWFRPQRTIVTYAKQILFEDECPFFEPGTEQLILPIEDLNIAPAICYESKQPVHAEHAVGMGANVYLASVAKHAQNMVDVTPYYANLAESKALTIVLANCVGPCDNFIGCGESSVWNNQGQLLARLSQREEGIVGIDTTSNNSIKAAIE